MWHKIYNDRYNLEKSVRQFKTKVTCELTQLFFAVAQLLPIPDSLPISPDDGEHADIYKLRIRVRGNLEWAPPRPQIIFNIHPAPKWVHIQCLLFFLLLLLSVLVYPSHAVASTVPLHKQQSLG